MADKVEVMCGVVCGCVWLSLCGNLWMAGWHITSKNRSFSIELLKGKYQSFSVSPTPAPYEYVSAHTTLYRRRQSTAITFLILVLTPFLPCKSFIGLQGVLGNLQIAWDSSVARQQTKVNSSLLLYILSYPQHEISDNNYWIPIVVIIDKILAKWKT